MLVEKVIARRINVGILDLVSKMMRELDLDYVSANM